MLTQDSKLGENARAIKRDRKKAKEEKDEQAQAERERYTKERQSLGLYPGVSVDEVKKVRRGEVTERSHYPNREKGGGQKSLIDGPIDLFLVMGSGETSDQDAHTGKYRRDEYDHYEKDLPAHANGGVGLEPDQISYHDMVYEPLEAPENVCQHRWPGDLPDRTSERALDDRTVKAG